MGKKDKTNLIIKEIEAAIIKEEMAVPIYTEHLETALFWAGIPDVKRKKITEKLKTLRVQSRGHIRLLKKVTAIVRKAKNNK